MVKVVGMEVDEVDKMEKGAVEVEVKAENKVYILLKE